MKSNSCTLLVITSLCLGSLSVSSAYAASYSIAVMNITSGGFVAYDYLNQPVTNPDSGGTFTPFSIIGSNTNLVGGYLGNTSSGALSGFWYGGAFQMYTAPSNLGGTYVPAGTVQGGLVPSGTLDNVAGTITMDLSSLFAYWGGLDFHQGTGKNDGVTSTLATGLWDSSSGHYSLSWTSSTNFSNSNPYVCDFQSPTCSAKYTLEGYAATSAVPVPAAVYLLGSGILGLLGFVSRRKSA